MANFDKSHWEGLKAGLAQSIDFATEAIEDKGSSYNTTRELNKWITLLKVKFDKIENEFDLFPLKARDEEVRELQKTYSKARASIKMHNKEAKSHVSGPILWILLW